MKKVIETSIGELDKAEWDDLLSKSEVCDAFQTYEWAKVLRNSLNVYPHFLMVQDNKETIGGIMFLRKRMFKFLDSYEVRGGPLYLRSNKDIVMQNVMKAFRKNKRKSMYQLFVPSPLINYSFEEMFRTEGYHPLLFRTILIGLERPVEEIWRALDKKARWGVRKAERLGVNVTTANTWRDWKQFYALHVVHSREKQYSTVPYAFFREMFKLQSKIMSRLFVAKCGKQIIAGSLFLIHKKNMIFLQNASSNAFLAYNPNNLIQWKSIEWAKGNGVTTYDLNGLPWEKTPYLRGIYQFKKRWDGRVTSLYYYLSSKILYSGVHWIRTSSFAWRLFLRLKKF